MALVVQYGGVDMGSKGERRRELLIQAALEHFSKHGYDGATTKAIAESTGVTEAALFRHFATKHDLFLAVIESCGPRELFSELGSDVLSLPAPDGFRRLLSSYLGVTWQHRRWLAVMRHEARRDDAAAEALRAQRQSMGRPLLHLLESWAERGEIDVSMVKAMRDVIVTSVRGFLDRMATCPPGRWERVRARFTDSLTAVLFPPHAGKAGKPRAPQTAGGPRQ
jgi:AcrR family transcriptional regulator